MEPIQRPKPHSCVPTVLFSLIFLFSVAALLFLAAIAPQAQGAVHAPFPGQNPAGASHQGQLNAMRPDDVVLLANIGQPSGPLTVRQPGTVIWDSPFACSQLILEGPGHGSVSLASFKVGWSPLPRPADDGLILCRGFDSVRFYGLQATGALRANDMGVYVQLERSLIGFRSPAQDGAALEVPYGDAFLLESELLEDIGRPSAICGRLLRSGGQVQGSIQGGKYELERSLFVSGQRRLGGRLTLSWTLEGPNVLLADFSGARPRVLFGNANGVSFVSDSAAILAGSPGPGALEFMIPSDVSLIGRQAAFQAYAPAAQRFSSPALFLIR